MENAQSVNVNFKPLEEKIDELLMVKGTKIDATDTTSRKPIIKTPPLLPLAGVFQSVLGSLSVKFFTYQLKEDNLWCTIDLAYEAKQGGSNGMTFLTCWYVEGKWAFKY
jgi:hypothetical protein